MPQPLNWISDLSQPQPGSDAALALGWTWPAARSACDEQKRGTFAMSWQLWLDMDSLPAIRAAKARRLASPCGLPWEVTGPVRAPGRLETEAAHALWKRARRLLRSTLNDVIGLGFSVWQHPTAINPLTLRREVITLERWPLNQVRYTATPFPDVWQPGKWIGGYYAIQFGIGDSMGATLYGPQDPTLARTPVPTEAFVSGRAGVWVRFIQLPRPGETDGHWTVVGEGDQPHLNGAICALDVSYVGGAILKRSGLNLAKTLGRQSPVGELPGTTAVDSPEGKALGKVVGGLGVDVAGAVIPGGSKIGSFSLTNQNAGLFVDFAAMNLADVELAILNHTGTTAKGDAQYVAKDGVEQAVPEELVRADVKTITVAFDALANLLAEQNTPSLGKIALVGHLPDTEQDARRKSEQEREAAEAEKLIKFHGAVSVERDNGFEFKGPAGQARLDAIAARCGVEAPILPAEGLPPALVKVPKPTVPITGEGGAPLPPPPPAAKVLAVARAPAPQAALSASMVAPELRGHASIYSVKFDEDKRHAVYHRDGYKCAYCGHHDAEGNGKGLSIDHIDARASGGAAQNTKHSPATNLVTACSSCNSAKQDRTPRQWGAYQKATGQAPTDWSKLRRQAAKPVDIKKGEEGAKRAREARSAQKAGPGVQHDPTNGQFEPG